MNSTKHASAFRIIGALGIALLGAVGVGGVGTQSAIGVGQGRTIGGKTVDGGQAKTVDDSQAKTKGLSPEQQKAGAQEPSAFGSVLSMSPAQVASLRYAPAGPRLTTPWPERAAGEVEPNGTFSTATPIGNNGVIRGDIIPLVDVDWYSFSANAGDSVFAALMTSFAAGSSTDSQLRLFASDGTTLLEFDDDDGALAGLSSTIAGAAIPTSGTYYLQVKQFDDTQTIRPYELHFRVQSGAPTPEVEGNDTPATANPLPANGYVSGARNPAVGTEQDWFSLALNAGDTVYLSLDLDPERDNVQWNGRLGFALFGDAGNQIPFVDDNGASPVPSPNPTSEALFFTVKNAGTYYAFVDSATAATGGPTATYRLSVSVHPAVDEGATCTTYTSTDIPKTIGPGTGLVSSTITVPGNPRIADLNVSIVLNHTLMQDIDATLHSPAGNHNGLFTDIGAAAIGGQNQMDTTFDDEAGHPPSFTAFKGTSIKPELSYRLNWFDGEGAGGVWTLDLRDDTANAEGGTLTSWSLRICEMPPAPTTTIFSQDFEANDGGFTHSGTVDEWERGTPATVATTTANPVAGLFTCNSGVNCWKTDLDSTYNILSSQELVSPAIVLPPTASSIGLRWAHWYQMESANFDHYYVDVREVGNPASARRVFEWRGATMTNAIGNPNENVPGSAGWALVQADITRFANKTIEVVFHVDTDNTVNFAGVAIDDVSVSFVASLQSFNLDCDGNGDVFTYNQETGAWTREVSNGVGGSTSTSGSWNPGWSVVPAHFDADNLVDLFLFNSSTGQWFRMRNDGTGFTTQASGTWWNGWQRFVMDLDFDGISDVFLYDPATGVWFKAVTTVGDFTYSQGGWAPDWEITPMRLNDDALGDLFLFNHTTGNYFWVLGAPGAGFAYPRSGTWYPGWQLYPGDFNGDGRADLLLHDPPTGAYIVATNGLGTEFTYTGGYWTAGFAPYVGDFNGDGRQDLLLHSASNGQWAHMISDGLGNFAFAGGQTWSQGWTIHLTDLNGDGKTDVLLYHPASGVWYQVLTVTPGSVTYTSGTWAPGLTIVTRAPIR